MTDTTPLARFHPLVRRWFERTYVAPSPPQVLGWPGIAEGKHTLILAPTGSGKTLAAFLWTINRLVEARLNGEPEEGVRVVYVSPLKALNNDIHRNLEEPLRGIRDEAARSGLTLRPITTAVRTGDTPPAARAAMLTSPPDILITTPESLYLMLTSPRARRLFRSVEYCIVDEIHAVCGNKRGVHLSLSLERLAALAEREFTRIGLSATLHPLDAVARFLGGMDGGRPRPVNVVDAGRRKAMDLRVECAAPDFSLLAPEGIWTLLFTEMLEQIRRHRTTLIFVNNRRLAERVAARLNELITGSPAAFGLYAVPFGGEPSAPPPGGADLVQAYHGSMARGARERMETDLKEGRLRALVATSSLELGIDIGSIDLVIQVQSPKGIARGLQRVGRSGHLVTAASSGRLYPSHREDLVESAVVAHAMLRHEVEPVAIPENCLDVLAQQIVAMVSVEEWNVGDLYALVRRSACYRDLSRDHFLGVLRMLAGRYDHPSLRNLRARISWDRVNDSLRALPGSGRLALTSGGTIADRGYFGVYLEDGRTKVGDVDEEFVLESRAGDTFILGSSVWRMTAIDANRITVTPAPGQPARMPFWRGEGIGRSFELGRRIGAFRRTVSARLDDPGLLADLQTEYPIDSRSAWNITEYLRKQRAAAGIVPDDRVLLVEGFRDEIGDPRIVVHSCFGRRVNALLGLLLEHRLRERTGLEPQMLSNDDGVLLRCADVDEVPLDLLEGITPAAAEAVVLNGILTSPLFAGQFRQNAGRALLMPRAAAGRRTPLWLQRLRAADLLEVVRQADDFPIVIETVRDVLHDVLDYARFQEIVRGIADGTIAVRQVRTDAPSPFAAGLLFAFIAVYMYEWDHPRADRLSQYATINRELLEGILDVDTMQALIRPEAVTAVEAQLQHTADGSRARSPEELLEILLRVGDLTEAEAAARSEDPSFIGALAANGRAVRMLVGGEERWIAGEERPLYENAARNAPLLLRRFLQTHGPVPSPALSERFGLPPEKVEETLRELSRSEPVQRSPGGRDAGTPAWYYRPTMERIQRATLHILRREISPCTLSRYTFFLFRWQHLAPGTQRRGPEAVADTLEQFEGLPLPAEMWEREILYRRVADYSRAPLQELCSAGEFVWTGSGPGRLRTVRRGNGALFLPPPPGADDASLSPAARRVLQCLRDQGALFYADLRTATRLSLLGLNEGIASLLWGGFITNDVFGELGQVRRPSRVPPGMEDRIELLDPYHNPRRARLLQSARRAIRGVAGWKGRWSAVHAAAVMGEAATPEEQAAAQARQLLNRYGILPREFHRREDVLPWPLIAMALHLMELRGEIRRGYFVEGLSGMQYALPEAVEELRSAREGAEITLVNACDPACPFGAGVGITPRGAEPRTVARLPSHALVFRGGAPVLLIEGRRVTLVDQDDLDGAREGLRLFAAQIRLPDELRPSPEIIIETCDGAPATASRLAPALRSLGFRADRDQTMRFDGYA